MIKNLSLLFLAGCMSNQGLSTMSEAQENIWNLSRICLGMNHCQVRRIMHEPYKTQCFAHEGHTYLTWFYVTRPSALDQHCLVKLNVTPVVFEDGILIGWGFDVYDCLLRRKETSDKAHTPSKPVEQAIDILEQAARRKPDPLGAGQASYLSSCDKELVVLFRSGESPSLQEGVLQTSFLTQNEVQEEEGCQCPACKPRKDKLSEEDDRMLEEANDQNFNFW